MDKVNGLLTIIIVVLSVTILVEFVYLAEPNRHLKKSESDRAKPVYCNRTSADNKINQQPI